MIVFIVKVECPADKEWGQKYFLYAIRSENEDLAVRVISNTLGFHVSMVSSCGAADRQENYLDLWPNKPKFLYSPLENHVSA